VSNGTAIATGSNDAAIATSQICGSRPPNSTLMKRLAT
jgi:hypothetical protein